MLNTGLLWNLLNVPPFADDAIRERKIYNTYIYGQSNAGHDFSDVLTDQEALAIIQYLKTL